VFTANRSFTSECVTTASWMHWTEWSQWSLDGSTKLLTVSYYIFLASTPLGWLVAGVTREWVRDCGWKRQRGSKPGSYTDCTLCSAQCLSECWLLRSIDSLAIASCIMWWPWQGEWSLSDASSPHITVSHCERWLHPSL